MPPDLFGPTPDEALDDRLLLTQTLTALLLGISVQAFARWKVQPVLRRGREALYYWPRVLEERDRRYLPDPSDEPTLNLDAERARLAAEQADKLSMENAVARKQLVYTQQVAELWGKSLTVFRQQLLTLHTRVGSKHGAAAAEDVRELVLQVMEELASSDWVADYGTARNDVGEEHVE